MPYREVDRYDMKLEELQDAMRRARAMRAEYFAGRLRHLVAKLRQLARATARPFAHAS